MTGLPHDPDLELLDALRALETALHRPEVRRDRARLGGLLHPGFTEIGRSGRVYTRAEILDALAGERDSAAIEAWNFELRRLGEAHALLTYRSAVRAPDGGLDRHALRSSVWQRSGDGWRIVFHQGTQSAAPVGGAGDDRSR